MCPILDHQRPIERRLPPQGDEVPIVSLFEEVVYRMLRLLDEVPGPLSRHSVDEHFTAMAALVQNEGVFQTVCGRPGIPTLTKTPTPWPG